MDPGRTRRTLFRFGVYEVDNSSGELRKSGVRLHLQGQPFQFLVMLLERPGQVVTREELRQRLWPANTFVDFDHSINTVVGKIRDTLSDSKTNPRFVETLAGRGYRFVAPVELIDVEASSPAAPVATRTGLAGSGLATKAAVIPPPPVISPPESPSSSSLSLLTKAEELPPLGNRSARALFFAIQVMYLSFYVVALARLPAVQTIFVITAAVGVPVRLYLVAAVVFGVRSLNQKFARLFPILFPFDELWALSPFLLAPQIGIGLSLAATAALIYAPFSQRTLLMMGERPKNSRGAADAE
jgi:cholera toxin transcriptional activator